jgi:hypothetical protein
MPLIKPPTVIALGQRKSDRDHYGVQFEYDFAGDTILPCNVGGVNFSGSVYPFDILSVRSSANLPTMKSMAISQSFLIDVDSSLGGQLIIAVASSGMVNRIGAPALNSTGMDLTATSAAIVTGVLPIVGNAPTQIQFGKEVNGDGSLSGKLTICMFTFELHSYIYSGTGNVL